MSARRLVSLCVVLAGCAGRSAVVLTVSSDGLVSGVDEIVLTVANAGQTASADYLVSPHFTFDGTNSLSLSARLPADRSGTTMFTVDAKAQGATLASGDTSIVITPGAIVDGTIVIHGGSPAVDATVLADLLPAADATAAAPDLAMPDLATPDLARAADLHSLDAPPATADLSYVDLVAARDLAVASDLVMARDLTTPDLATPDLATPDLVPAPPALIQASGMVASVATSVSPHFGSMTTAGTLLVASYAVNYNVAPVFPAGWIEAATSVNGSGNSEASVWYYPNNPGGILTVDILNANSTSASTRAILSEWSGVTAKDQSVTMTATMLKSYSIAATPTGSLAIATFAERLSGSSTITFSAMSGWQNIGNDDTYSTNIHLTTDYLIAKPTGGSVSETETSDTTGTSWMGVMTTFK